MRPLVENVAAAAAVGRHQRRGVQVAVDDVHQLEVNFRCRVEPEIDLQHHPEQKERWLRPTLNGCLLGVHVYVTLLALQLVHGDVKN